MRPRRDQTEDRISELQAELTDARLRLAALADKLEQGGALPDVGPRPVERSVGEAAAHLERLIEARTSELEEKTFALEAANHELRSLTQNLDQIVRQRTRALAESESQLRRKNVELDRLNRLKAEFISIAAHELRTPMTSVVGYLDLIAERRLGELPRVFVKPLSSLRRNAHRLKRLIDDMLDVSRLEAGRMNLRRRSCSLGDIALAAIDEMTPLAASKSHKMSAEIADVAPIDADPDKVHQVVVNLIVNSIKYTGEGGEIHVRVDGEGAYARMRVWDNGIGIPVALRGRIFEPFSDVHTAKHHTSSGPDSAGLGLYIARGIVELHGGSISVDSEEGKFSEFTILLPLATT